MGYTSTRLILCCADFGWRVRSKKAPPTLTFVTAGTSCDVTTEKRFHPPLVIIGTQPTSLSRHTSWSATVHPHMHNSTRSDQTFMFSGSRKNVKIAKLLGASLSGFSRQPVPTTRNRRSKKPWTTSRYRISRPSHLFENADTCRLKNGSNTLWYVQIKDRKFVE